MTVMLLEAIVDPFQKQEVGQRGRKFDHSQYYFLWRRMKVLF